MKFKAIALQKLRQNFPLSLRERTEVRGKRA